MNKQQNRQGGITNLLKLILVKMLSSSDIYAIKTQLILNTLHIYC